MRTSLRFAIVSCFLLSTLGPATASDLSDLRGSWSGRGTLKESPDGPMRRGSCRVGIQGAGAGSSVTLSGRCAGPGKAASFGGTIAQRGGRAVSARFSSPGRPSISYSGTHSGSSVSMRSSNAVTVDGRTYRLQLWIRSQGPNSFSMTQQATEVATGKRSQVFNMAFQRK